MEKRARARGGTEFTSNVRFGPFELDFRRRELRKEGRKIRLQEQPFQILKILLESPGEVISREEIRERLWPDEAVVEFDHSINAAIRRLRDALRDSADNPRYIRTIARQGYCFVGKAETEPAIHAEPVAVVAEAVVADKELKNPRAEETPPGPGRPLNLRMVVAALLVMIALIVWASASYFRRGPHPQIAPLQPLMRLDVDLGNDGSLDLNRGPNAILSPDGTRLVYVSRSKLFTRRLDEAQTTELPGTEGAQYPFFSPDGQWLGFFAAGSLKKVSIQQGQVIRLCDGSGENGAAWGEDGNIIVGVNFRLARLPSGGGTPVSVTELEPGEIVHRWPRILPGGKAVLFSAYRSLVGLEGATIDVVSLKDGRRKTVVRGGTWGQYLPSGHLVYINQGTLFAVAFDADRLEVQGTPTPVLENVAYRADRGSAEIDFSRTGTLVYQSSTVGAGLVTVQWLDESGNTRPLLPVPGNYLSPTLSPDGTRLALSSAGDIWLYEFGRGSMTRLTVGGGYSNPLWTADGRHLLFRALSQRTRGIWWIRADGIGQPQWLMQSNNLQVPWSFPAEGKRLAFNELSPVNIDDIWTVPVETGSSGLRVGKPELFLQTPFHQRAPTFSPDGRWMAYQSNESGRYQIYVQSFPEGHGRRQISGEGGTHPAWSPKGHELFFISGGVLMSVSYQAHEESFVVGKARVWFEKKIANFGPTQSFAPAPDGKSIVALMPAEPSEEHHDRVIFLLNFFDELRRRVPSRTNQRSPQER